MNRDEVKTVEASLIEHKEGQFCLDVAEIKLQSTTHLKVQLC
jgi:hypothetical protein